MGEGPFDGHPEAGGVEDACRPEERDIRQVLDPGVRPRTRHRVGVELLCDVGLQRIDAEDRGLHTRKGEEAAPFHLLDLPDHGLGEGDVHSERRTVDLASEQPSGPVTASLVDHSLRLDFRVAAILLHLEKEEVAEVESPGLLEPCQHIIRVAEHPEVDVLRGSRSLKPQLEDDRPLEDDSIAEERRHPGEEAVEDKKLAETGEFDAASGGLFAQPVLDRLLECYRGSILS
jgi:hypothetical protein